MAINVPMTGSPLGQGMMMGMQGYQQGRQRLGNKLAMKYLMSGGQALSPEEMEIAGRYAPQALMGAHQQLQAKAGVDAQTTLAKQKVERETAKADYTMKGDAMEFAFKQIDRLAETPEDQREAAWNAAAVAGKERFGKHFDNFDTYEEVSALMQDTEGKAFVGYFNPETGEAASAEIGSDEQKDLAGREGWFEKGKFGVTAGKPSDLTAGFVGSKKEAEALRSSEVGVRKGLYSLKKIVTTLKENPEVLMTGGKAAAVLTGLRDEMISAYKGVGFDVPAKLTSQDNYNSHMEGLGIKDDVTRGQVFDAALAYASAMGLGEGRALTDKDVKRAIDRVSSSWGTSVASRMATLKDVGEAMTEAYKINYNVMHDSSHSYKGDLGEDFASMFDEVEPAKVDGPAGAELTATHNMGKRGIAVKDGKWVYVDTGEVVEQ